MTIKPNRIERYYDTHPLEGDELTQSLPHFAVIEYLIAVIKWFFSGKRVGVVSNVNFYQTANPFEPSISPDIAVVEGLVVKLPELQETTSYYVGIDGPPPRLVIEIASKETWKQDLEEKPAKYYALGVSEYFVYDPSKQPVWTRQWRNYNRLVGWRRNPAQGQFELLPKDETGRLWSQELDSWLAVEPEGLRLYTADNKLRLTEAEAGWQRADRLAEMLRKLGHNPDDLS
jgi:Uma2 family endonuclease